MTVESTRVELDVGLYLDVSADGRAVMLTTEAGGRTTARIRMTIAAFAALQNCRVRDGATRVEDAVKRLR